MGTWYHLALPQALPLPGEGLEAREHYCTELWSRLFAEVPGVQQALRLLLGVSSSPSLGLRVERSTAMEGRTERRGKEANSIGGT